jgi:hypothetical protein
MHTPDHRLSTLVARCRRLLLTSTVLVGAVFAFSAGEAKAACSTEYVNVPESSTGVSTRAVAPGERFQLTPQGEPWVIWPGSGFFGAVYYQGLPYPAGLGYPAWGGTPPAKIFSLLYRMPEVFGHTSWRPITEAPTVPIYLGKSFHVELRVNDPRPGDGWGAFRVRADYGC